MPRPLRIAYLIPEFPGQTHVLFWREVVRLRELGHQVELVSTRRPTAACPHPFREAPCRYLWPPALGGLAAAGPRQLQAQWRYLAGLRHGGARGRLRAAALLPSAWTLRAWLRRARIDHLHVHSFGDAAHLAALASSGGGVPYSLVLHGALPVFGGDHLAKARGAAFLGAVSEPVRQELRALGAAAPIVDLPCGVPLEVFAPVARGVPEVLRFVSVSRLHQGKCIHWFLDALAQVGREVPWTYSIVGDGPVRGDLEAQVQRLGLGDRVRFLGSRDEAAVARILHDHDVMVLTSSIETTAIAVREAMATGLPVLMTRVGEAERMVVPGATGQLVEQADVAGIAAAARWFWAQRAELPAMGERAAAHARRHWSHAATVDRLVEAIAAVPAPGATTGSRQGCPPPAAAPE